MGTPTPYVLTANRVKPCGSLGNLVTLKRGKDRP